MRTFILTTLLFLTATLAKGEEKVSFYNRPASVVKQSTTIAEGREVVGKFYYPRVSCGDSANILINISIDKKGNVVSAKLDSTSVFKEKDYFHSPKWLAKAHISAAKKLKFNPSPSAPALQSGTVSYICLPK